MAVIQAKQNGLLRLPPWKVPDASTSTGVLLAAVLTPLANDWTAHLPQASQQAGYPICWIPNTVPPWFGANVQYTPKGTRADQGYLIKRPRTVCIHWAQPSPPAVVKEMLDAGNILQMQGPANESTGLGLLAGFPNHTEVMVTSPGIGPNGPVTNSVGFADPTTFVGGDLLYIYYMSGANGVFAFNGISNDFSGLFLKCRQATDAAVPAFEKYGRVNLLNSTDPDTIAGYNAYMAALGPYGTSQTVTSDPAAFGAMAAAIKTFFAL